MLNLAHALRLDSTARVAFVGAGGKTTAMFQAARSLCASTGGGVLLTTTTHLGDWQVGQADRHFVWADGAPRPELESLIGNGLTLLTGPLAGHRYTGLAPAQIEQLRQLAGYHDLPLLIEADGSRQKPLKAPAEHEPVIPDFADTVVVVAGLSALNRPLDENCVHRPELFSALGGLQPGQPLSPEAVTRLLLHPQGGLKNIPSHARRIALLNQADTPALQAAAQTMAGQLLQAYDAVIIAALGPTPDQTPTPPPPSIFAAHENIAGIILAAGEASRFGKTKQLLDYHGRPFVRAVAETALAAGLAPVIVVTGANAEAVERALTDLPIVAIRSNSWKAGQSASIRAGIAALTPSPRPEGEGCRGEGGAIFLLADQPQVTPEVLRALVERHAQNISAIVAPLAGDRRANPVLFDRGTFKDLLALNGDVGGRVLFTKYPVEYLPWHDESLLLDVDTEDDYRKLLAWGVED